MGDSAAVSFTGSFVTVIYSQSSVGGSLAVSIDGINVDTLTENYPYQSSANPGDPYKLSRTYSGLPAGPHTLTLTAGAASPGSSATTVNIDAVIVPQ